jgi:carbon-monoxide dehydrogenase large subunit
MQEHRYGRSQGWIGASIRRKEDGRLLTGNGRYVDDWNPPGTLHLAILRSPHAHARIRRVDITPALACPGVVAAVDGATVRERLGTVAGDIRKQTERAKLDAVAPGVVRCLRMETRPLVAVDKAHFVGEPVALVLADSRYAAEDALERVVVEYEPLPAVVDAEQASRPDAPRVHDDLPDNLSLDLHLWTGDVDAAFAQADRVVRRRFRMQRITGIPIETRGALAQPEPDGGVTVWAATQAVHVTREGIAHHLGLDEERVRVVAQDVGGGFGIKSGVFPEAVLVAWLAREHGRPVKWIEDRLEHLRSATQTRDQVHDIALALRPDGTILGLRDRFVGDCGTYNVQGLGQPHNSALHLIGPYRVPAADIEGLFYFTNKPQYAPYRGAGRPEAVFAIERLMDEAARELGLDPADIRRRNMITAAEMPYNIGLIGRDCQVVVYDSGDYLACLEEALRLIDYEAVRREQPALWARGIYRGVGLAAYVESTGSGPFEGASIGLDAQGHVWVYTGACSQGQGHETTLAQIVADQLGVHPDAVTVVPGDTGGIRRGQGARSSRLAVTAGSAVAQASQAVAERLRALAATLLEAAPGDLELADGAVRVRGVPDRAVTFAQLVARAAAEPAPPGSESGLPPGRPALFLRETRYYEPPTFTYTNAVHAAQVEVDVETGVVHVRHYVVVHDCGRVINPVVANGQICGGVAQGLGNALLEELVYDEHGQLLTSSLMDYLVPTSCEVPHIALGHFESPSPRNPIGVKGLGEGGAIGPPAAIANAVTDALRPFGVEVTTLPLTPERVLALIEAARASAAAH